MQQPYPKARETLFATTSQCPGGLRFPLACHAQSLAAMNRVTEQLSWLAVDSFFMSCSISWMVSLIDNLYLLDLIVLVIN
jgi:hypothetical protein